MDDIIPIEKNADRGFHYTVTIEQIRAHQKRTLAEIFEWLEKTNKFIYNLQTPEEREKARKIKGKYI